MNALSSLRLALLSLAVSVSAFAAERFQVKVSGHGRPLLLVPGLSCSGEVWDATVARYQDRYECHVFTLAGFAGVPAAEGEFIAPVREALADYIRTQHLDRPIVVGHSLGGFLAADLAAFHPDLTGPVVVVDAYPFLSGITNPGATPESAKVAAQQMKQQLDQVPDEMYRQGLRSGQFTRSMVIDDAQHEKIIAWSLATDRRASGAAMTEMLSRDQRELLGQVKVPMLVLASWIAYAPYATHDMTDRNVRSQYSRVPHLSVGVSDTARHFIMLDDPTWFYSQIDTFLAANQ